MVRPFSGKEKKVEPANTEDEELEEVIDGVKTIGRGTRRSNGPSKCGSP